MTGPSETTIAFAREWWKNGIDAFLKNTYAGVTCLQHPFDAWITEEIIWETRPDVIVECGSFFGGSALRWASHLELAGIDGTVVAIDINDNMAAARKVPVWDRRVRFLRGSTVDPVIVDQVARITSDRRTMVILDSDHKQPHVAAELDAYASMVTPGCYLIVQDGFISSIDPKHGPGPLEASEEFVAADDRFEVDESRERMLFTFNPSGFLRRRGGLS